MLKKALFLFFCSAIFLSTNAQNSAEEVSELMTGSFSSEAQTKQNDAFQNVTVHMYEIWSDWSENHDEIWIYVEQAMASTPDEPYRQRVYLLTNNDDESVKVSMHEFHTPSRFAGKWKDLKFFDNFDNTILSERAGCDIILTKDGDSWVGTTNDKDCKSDWKGASYTTSEVSISKGKLTSLDRGYDASGQQVWGSENGAYIFLMQ